MKIRFYLALAAAALVMTNCSKDEEVVNGSTGTKSFTATIEGASRSAANPETGAFSWTAGDKISVYNGSTFDVYANSEGNENNFVAESDEAGTATKYAIYPAGEHSVSGEVVTVNLPAEYTYGSTNAPMLASIEGTNLSFKHLAGVMRFVVKNVPANASKFVFTATNDIITGNYEVVDGQIAKNGTGTVNNNNSVTITFNALGTAQDMEFYVPLPIGTYGNYTVAIQSEDGTTVALENESEGVSNTIGRRTLLLMPEFTVENNQLKKGAGSTIPVTQEEAAISGNQSVTINTTGVSDATATLELNYTPQEGNATLSLSDGNAATTPQTSAAKVQINPQGSTPVEALNINTPTLTVELGTGSYGTVEALTATETLIIGEGVTIGTLTINGGKVEIADGATIGEFIVKDADALKTAIEAGYEVKLAANITLTEPITIAAGKESVLDLNEQTLTYERNDANVSGYAFINYGKFELSNGTIIAKGSQFALGLYNEGEAIVNCTITSENSNAIKVDNGGKLTVNGGKYESKNATGQALRVGNWQSGKASAWELYINGGEFIGPWAGLYIVNNYDGLQTAGKAEIKNATFTGSTDVVDSGVKGSDIVFDKVKNVTLENCTFKTSTIHSETEGESVINDVTITTTDDIYSKLYFVSVSTAETLKSIIEAGGKAKLAASFTLTEPITITAGKESVLDLNGQTLTYERNDANVSGYAFINYGKFELSNGTIIAKGSQFALGLYNEGEAIVNCTITSENSNAIKVDNGGKLTVNGGKYESKNATGQGLRVGNWQSGKASAWELYINGGEFIGPWAGLYIVNNYDGLQTAGKAEIKNATFTGSTGVVDSGVKGSDIVFDKVKNVTISGCTFTTSSIHSESTNESQITTSETNTITTTDDVYSTLFGSSAAN